MNQYNPRPENDSGKIFGLILLAIIWIWLVYYMFSRGGVDGKNILIALFSGIIVFVPLWKRYISPILSRRKNSSQK